MAVPPIPLAEKPSSQTKAAPIRGALVGLIAVFIFGTMAAAIPSFRVVGLITAAIFFLGFLGGSRSGKCPNCGAGVFLQTGKTKGKCSDCKHRLVVRNKRLIDVT